jgi:hypothetical protein
VLVHGALVRDECGAQLRSSTLQGAYPAYRARDIGMYVGTCRGRRSRFGPNRRNCLNPCERNMAR